MEMKQKKTMLYIMGIDWNWIYQRPQVLAEKLSQDYEVTVVFPRSVLKKRKGKEIEKATDTLHFRVLTTIPYQEKNVIPGKVSRILNKKVFKDINSFDYIYVGYPQYARYIPQSYSGKIIYDCMDDFARLYSDQKRVHKVVEQENLLIRRCDLLLASAIQLQKKVDAIVGFTKSVLLRNALKKQGELSDIQKPQKKGQYRLCYIGTISEWMDNELLLESCERLSNIQYKMIGPAVKRVECERIQYAGPIEHEKLQEAVADCDCLVMPFVVNDIVLSVDPVKLYEYIAFGKCIISVYYPEVERFGDFVYFYHNKEEYVELLQELIKNGFPAKYNKVQQREFIQENTWDKRYKALKESIEIL